AKERDTTEGETLVDRLFLPGQKNALPIRASDRALALLLVARDEAHRVSNALRVKKGKTRLRSRLDDIRGIGPRTRSVLLRALGSAQAVAEASEETLIAAGATERQAKAIRQAFLLEYRS